MQFGENPKGKHLEIIKDSPNYSVEDEKFVNRKEIINLGFWDDPVAWFSKNLMYGKKRLLKHINHSNTIKNVFENITKDFSDYEKHNKRRDDLSLFGFSIA